jgi:hypothetical protein
MHGDDQEPSKEQDGGLNIRNKLVPKFPTTLFGPAGRIFMDGGRRSSWSSWKMNSCFGTKWDGTKIQGDLRRSCPQVKVCKVFFGKAPFTGRSGQKGSDLTETAQQNNLERFRPYRTNLMSLYYAHASLQQERTKKKTHGSDGPTGQGGTCDVCC